MWSEEYQCAFLDMYHKVFDRLPFVVGEHVWNFADFATSQGIIRVGGNKKAFLLETGSLSLPLFCSESVGWKKHLINQI
jgi:beta-galactosidase/beta-glucuronidase